MSLAHMFYAKQAFRRAMRYVRQWRQQRRHAPPARSFMIEALEPRLLMSANPATLATIALTNVANLQPATVEGAQFPPGAFTATAGSRLHESFTTAGEVDAFYFDAIAGQHMALELIAHTSAIQGRVEILDPNGVSIGSVDAGTAGGYVLLQDKVLSQTGTYTVEFESLNGTGTYDGNVFVGTTALPTVAATTNNWINAAGGNWSVGSNWSRGLAPTTTDIVGITLDGTYTVTMDVSSTVAGLVLGGNTGTQSLTMSSPTLTLNGLSQIGTHGTFNLNGGTLTGTGEIDVSGRLNWNGGTMSGTGLTLLTPGAGFALAPSSGSVTLGRTLENQTTATWTSGQLFFLNGTVLNKGTVTASGTVTAANGGGVNQFLNQGAFIKQGTGAATFNLFVPFNNSNIVEVQAGSLDLAGGGTHTGDFTVTGSTLFTNGTHTFQNTSDVIGTGTLRVNGGTATFGGTVQVGAITSNGTTTFGPVLQTSLLAVGAGTTTINTALSVNQLDLAGGTLTGTGNLTVGGAFNWNAGTMSGTGTTLLTPGAAFALAPTSGAVTLSRVLENQANATWSSGNMTLTGGTFLNKGTLTVSGTVGAANGGGTNQFLNQGAFIKQGALAATFNAGVAFNNLNLVEVQSGSLDLAGGGTHTGDFTVTGSTLFTNGTHTFQSTSDVTGTGTLRINGGTANFGGAVQVGAITSNGTTTFGPVLQTSYLAVGAGTTTINTALSLNQLDLGGGTLTGSGNFTIGGVLNWNGGTMSGTGLTVLTPGATFGLAPTSGVVTLSRVLENQTNATWTSGQLFFLNGTVLNKGTLTASGAVTAANAGGTNQFLNQGAFIKQGTGAATFNLFVPFQNDSTGTVTVQAGTLSLVGGGTHTGDFTVSATAVLDLNGTHVFGVTSDVTGMTPSSTGIVQVSGGASTFGGTLTPGTLVILSGAANVNIAAQISSLVLNNGALGGSGDVTLTGASTWSSGTMSGTGHTIIGPTGTLTMPSAGSGFVTLGRVLANQGATTWTGNQFRFNNGQFLNTGLFTASVASGFIQSFGDGGTNNRFTNQGTFRKQGAGLVQFTTNVTGVAFDNQGTIEIQNGTLSLLSNSLLNFSGTTLTGGIYQISGAGVLQFTGANIVTNAANIILSGTAPNPIINESSVNALANFATNAATGSFSLQGGRDFTRTGNFTNNGALSLGAGSIFTVTGGTYIQAATGVLTVQINGLSATTNVGKLAVSGNASLNGTLNIQLTDGYVPVIGDTFQILSFGSLTGDFPTVNGLNFRSGLRFLRNITPTGMTLTVVEDGNFPGPTVTSSSPAEGAFVPPGTLTYQATFSEAMATTNLGAEDVILRDKLTNTVYSPATFNFDTLTNRVTVTYNNVTESDYEIRLISSDTAFRGNSGGRLDGDGDGREGGDYFVNFTVDNGTRAFDGTFQNAKPLGSLVRESSPVFGRFHATDDFDIYDLSVDAGQVISLRFTPLDASVRGSVEVLGTDGITPLGFAQALNPNDTVLLQTIPTTTTGTYKIKLARLAGAGTYQVVITLNAALEIEQFVGVANNTAATAQNFTSSATALQGTAARLAVTGTTEAGQPDYYQFDLVAGQGATIELATVNVAALVSSELRDVGDVLLATGIKETANTANQAIRNFIAPITSTYYVRVSGEANRAYTLVVTKTAEFDRESNSMIATAQDISITGQVLGSLGYATETASAIDSQDHYLVRANAGDVLTITTSTPGGLANTLNPKIELFTQSGTSVLASDLTSAGDGRNARIANFAVTTTGVYRIVVTAESGVGEYSVNVTGATGAPVPFTIVSQTVPNGELRTTYPTTFRVDLSEPINLSSLQASDLQIQRPGFGTPVSADNVTIIDQDTVEFTLTSAQAGDGIYTLTIPAGAFTSLTNKPLQTALTSTFDLDAMAPRVFNTNLIEGSTVAPDATGNLTVNIQFTEPLDATTGLVGWWQGEGNTNDSQGSNNGALLNGAGFSSGVGGQGFLFDGVDDNVRIPFSSNLISQTFSVEAWVKPLSQVNGPTGQELIVGQGGGSYFLVVRPGTTGLKVGWGIQGTNGTYYTHISSAEIPINSFSHVAGTWDGTALKIYINGVLDSQLAPGVLPTLSPTYPFDIGGFATMPPSPAGPGFSAQQFFNGVIDDVKIYNRTLSAPEIGALPKPGNVTLRDTITNATYTPSSFSYNPANSTLTLIYSQVPDSAYALTLLSSATGFHDLRGNLLDGDANGTAGGNWVRTFGVDTTTRTYPAALQPLAPVAGLIYSDNIPASNRGLLSWWQGEGNATDSADGNSGTLQGGTTFASGQIGQGFQFDGVDDYVNIPDSTTLDSLTTAATVSMWIKPEGPGYIFSRRDPLLKEQISLFFDGVNLGLVVGTATAVSVYYTAPGVVTTGAFYHIAATVNTVTGFAKLYVNGVDLPLSTTFGPSTLSGTLANVTNLFLGRRQSSATFEGVSGTAHYKGLIDDVRLYSRALSSTEIAAQAGRLPVAGRFNSVGDVDAYTLNLDSGQQLSVTLRPGDTPIQGVINTLDPNGALIGTGTAGSAGATVFLQNVPVALSGVYTVQVSSQAGTGAYSISTTLNAAVEAESFGGSTNNDLASAVDLTPSAVTLQRSAVRYAVTGQTESATPDVYRFDLLAGQAATLVLTSTDGTALSNSVDLLDAAGVVLAAGLQDGTNVDRAIRNFLAPAAGTYFIRINAGTSKPYSLVVTRGAGFEREPDGTVAAADDISLTVQALGALESRASVVRTTAKTGDGNIRVAVVGTSGGDNVGFTATVNQLNNDTFFDFTATLVTASQVDTLAELQAYDVVVIGENGLNQNQFDIFAPALRSWVESGGGVVATGWTILGAGSSTPPVVTDVDAIVPVNTQAGYSNVSGATVSPNTTVHPVTSGVSSFVVSSWTEYPTTAPLVDAGATILGTVSGQPTIVAGRPGAGRSVYLGPIYGGYPGYNTSDLRSGSADRLLEQAVAWAGARDQVDQYLVQATTGELRVTTTTPGGDTGEPNNTLVPKLELFNSAGLLVASNQNGAPDGRNAQIVYQVPTGSAGAYRVVVSAVSGSGEYTLAATGTAVVSQNAAPTVVATTPVNGARLATPPTTIDLTFSEGMRIDSISSSDLQISGGGTVTGVQVLDGKTFRFTVSVPDVPNADTTYTVTLAAGAVSDLQGNTNALFTSTFVVDHVGPRIIAQTPAVQASSPWNSLTVTFSEPINAASLTAADVVLTGPSGNITITSITGAGTTFTLNFAAQTTAGAYTVTIGPNITDTVGNLMDQNNNGINGEAGTADAYTATVALQAPNLRVQSVTTNPVSAAQFGQPMTVTWTVENAGADPAREAWSDKIWLSTNQTLETATDIALSGLIASGLTGPLNAGGIYTKNATVTLPLNTSLAAGTYFILVQTDAGSAQLETNEADNVTASALLTLTVPPLPDLVVTNISGPTTARPGEQVAISWMVTNNGTADATGTWNDFVFLSSDNAIGGDRFVASFAFTGTIAAGQSIVRTQNLTMPTDVSGAQRLVVQTDASGQMYEHNNENNNMAIDDQVITMIAPDLQVSNIQLPALSFSGQPITVTWTLTNNGTADFTGTFSDRLSLSGDAVIGSDTFIADVPFTGALAIGQSVQRSHTFTVDRNLSGSRWAVVFTDISGNVLEYPNEGNNAAISAQPTNVTLQFSDLTVEAVSAPATAQSGDPIQVTWRVRNQGTLPTDVSSWTDQIILSADAVLDASDTTRINVTHSGALAVDAAYTGQATVTLPQGIAGDYYIFVQTDIASQVFESTAESNNVGRTLTPTTVSLKPYPDFQVTTVTGPTSAQPGQTATISWTVANNGTGPASTQRFDYVYLSVDGTLTGAIFLTAASITASVSNGGSYNASATVTIPTSLADGSYRFVIVTDAGNALYEGPFGGDANNLGQSGPVQITHTDLRVSIASAPATTTSGTTIGVDWTVTNNGTGVAQGNWVDRVYLSTNNTFEAGDVLLGELARTGPLANGGNYTAHRDVVIPIDKSGPFFLLVVTDAASQVFETNVGGAETNNTAASLLNVTLAPYADLETYNVTVDSQVVGNPAIVTVGWSVRNAPTGTGTGTTATWTDAIIASTDTVVGNSDDRLLATYSHTGLLGLGDSYAQSQTFYLPVDYQGRYHLFVKTDSTGLVFENAKETNNAAEAANVLDVLPVLYADLQVDSLTVPQNGQSGSSIRISWTVSNQGIGITNQGTWFDRVYLSSDPQGASVIQDYGLLDHSGPLQPLAAYTRTADLILPNTLNGSFYVVIETAKSGNVFEFIYASNNKRVSATPVNVSLSPTPDLAVTNIQTQTNAFEGSKIDITWTVTNQGDANAGGTWSDRVVLRKIGDTAGAITVGTFAYDRGLAAGLSYTRTEQFSLPSFIQGQYQIEVLTDVSNVVFERNLGAGTGETNNTVLDPDILTVQLRARPDLQVSNVLSPVSVPAGSGVSLEYTIINQGTAATPSIWKENVYLSLDNTVTYDDILIGSFDNVAALDPGQSYTRTTPSVQVPIRFRGNVFLLVSTDHNSQVDEFPNDGNNVFAKPLFVEPYPLSDLYTGNVVAPDQVLPSTQIEVRYRVENRGSNTTDKTTWTDTLWLTVDKTRPYAGKGDILLGTFTHQGAIPVGDFYEQVVTVTIPDASRLRTGINTYYITPRSDTYDVVLEDTLAANKNPDDPNQIDNNNYKARAVIVIGNPPPVSAPLPDVMITNVTALTPAEAEKPFTVRWTVTNQGQGVVPGGWEDSLWLSSASTLNVLGAVQWHLGTVAHAQGLAAGATATFEETFILSPATTGTFVIVETARNVSETSKSNNTAFAATTSVIAQSDLRVSSVVVPVSADSGEKVHVQWTVENVGNAAVWSGTQYWTDHVYLSSEPAYSFRAIKVGFLTHSNATTLAAGASYTAELDVTIPAGIEGPYFIHVIADANQDQFNFLDVRQETNPGSNPGALIHYRTSVYEAGNVANNFGSASLPVVYKEPDLVATTVTAPATASSGQPLTVSWTTTNQGTRATRQSVWTDRIYLSLDSSLDSTDRDLGFLNHTGILAQGASYAATTTLDLPIGVAGTYFLLVFPDATRSSTGDLVPEFRGEGNNIKTQSITITLTTPPDLQVTQLTIPERVTTGQGFNVSYQVSNQGGQSTPASQSVWNDLVYLSRDTFFDAQADRYLGTIGHTGGLAVGQSYGITQSFKAPNDLSGSYYVLVITDPRNASGVSLVYEGNAEQNNDRASTQPLLIEQPPPADLEVQSITAGGTVKAGDPIHIEWTVKNNGPNVATGAWSDSVYLSTDDTWDINDRLLGQKSFSGPLIANQTYSLTLDSTVPPVAAGQYRIIVRTDIRNQVFEGVNEINNRRFSSDVVNVTVDSIQLGVPFNTTLSTGQDRLYKVTVLEGETLRVRVSTAANDAANEVYLRFNQAPTPFQFDAGPNTQLQPNTTAIIPATQPGEYYILIHGQSEPSANTPVTLLADTLPFGITDVVKDQGGDSKYVTFTINGAKFSPNAVVKLVRPDIAEYVPVNINVVNSTKILATFDFTDAPHGLYDVKVINPDGATAILPYRYLVERFIQPDVTIGIGGPRVIPVGEVGTFGISLQSLTNLDTPYVSFQFGVSEMGRNSAIFNFPFLQFANNLRGQPDGVREDVPWASLESDINAQGPLNNYNTSTGYAFDLVAGGFTGVTFNIATYPGLKEFVDREWEALKEKIYSIDPSLRASGVLDNGPEGLDQIFPGFFAIYNAGANPITDGMPPFIPFRFNVFAAATALTRDEFVAQQTAEALTLRAKILADTTANSQLRTLAADADTWTSAYLAALEESGLLRPIDAIPPVREHPNIVSLLGVFATGVLVGPAGDQFQTSASLSQFFDKIHQWYGDQDPSTFVNPWPTELRVNKYGDTYDMPVPNLPQFSAVDLGLSQRTHFEAFDIFVPYLGFDQRGAAGTVALPDFASTAATPLSALDFSQFYADAASGGQLAAIQGPQGFGAQQFLPTGQRLPYQIKFENPSTSPTRPGEIRVVAQLDSDLDPRSVRLGDLKLGDIQVHIPSDRATFQGDFNFVQSKGYILRVSAGVDVEAHTATWLLQAIDPETGEIIEDTTKGLLAQNNAQGAGLGSVSYSVLPNEGLTTGTDITAQARVLFNTAPPADAAVVTQKVDGRAPVTTLTTTKLGASDDYQLQWSATDDAGGSGVRHTTVYVAEDGGDFLIWQQRTTETSGIYQGQAGHTYEFFAVSTDNAGNRELPPIGLNGPDDGTTTNLGSLPSGETTPTDLPPPPAPTPSTNPLFVQVQQQIPGTRPATNPSDFTSVINPFTVQSFATSFQQSHGGIGPLAILPLADGSVLVSGGLNRGQLFKFSANGGQAITPLITLDVPIYDLAMDGQGRLWASSGGGALLELNPTTGAIIHQFGDGITQAIAIHPTTGKIYVSSGDGIEIFDPVTLRFSHFTNYRVDDLAFSSTGELWGTSWPKRGDVVKFANNGKATVMVRLESQVDSIAFGQAGTPLANLLFVSNNAGAEGKPSDLVMVDIVSLQTAVIARGGPRAETVATTADGRLFIAQADQIDVLNAVLPPVVIATTPINQGFAPLPIGAITVRFDQDMLVDASANSVLNPANYQLTGQLTGPISITSVQYDAATRTARLEVDALQVDNFTVQAKTTLKSQAGLALLQPFTAQFSTVSDFSNQLNVEFLSVRSDRGAGTISYDVKVTNTTSINLLVPMRLVLDPSQYFQGAPIGATFAGGIWLIDLSATVGGGILQPGQSSTAQTITINNPFAQRADFGHGVYAVAPPNQPPVITSAPVTTATAGTAFTYQVVANDPDGIGLTYFLASSPAGMTVSATGLVSWTPAVSSPENASIVLQVYDARGAYASQAFSIVVTGVNAAPVVLALPGTGSAGCLSLSTRSRKATCSSWASWPPIPTPICWCSMRTTCRRAQASTRPVA